MVDLLMSTTDDLSWSTMHDMNTMSERLRMVRKERGLTQEALGRAAGVTKQAISAIEKGKTSESTASTADRICTKLGINHKWLVNGLGPRDAVGPEPEWDDVLAFAQAVSLGDGVEAAEYAETHKLKFKSSSLRRKRLRPPSLSVVYGRGDSMLPRIHDGDAILFDLADTTPADKKLFVIETLGARDHDYSVKRCREFAGAVFFDSLNPDGDHRWRDPRRMDDPRSPIKIIGRVRWIGSWED